MKHLTIAVLLTLCIGPAFAQDEAAGDTAADYPLITNAQVLANSVVKVIQPGFVTFEAKTSALAAVMDRLCQGPNPANLVAAKAAFADVVMAYGRIEIYKFGPLVQQNRAERLLFWPDARGIALRQVQQLLADPDETATTVEGLKTRSVALQGLGALELVLHGSGAETLATPSGDFRCRYGDAIAHSVARIGAEMAGEWLLQDGVATHLMVPEARYEDYRTTIEAMEEIVGTLSHGIEMVRDTKLLPFLGRDGRPAPRQAVLWRSGLTMALIGANFEGLETLFDASRIGQAVQPAQAGLEAAVRAEFDQLRQALTGVTSPVAEALDDPRQVAALGAVMASDSALQDLLGNTLSAALSLSVGFSALDGD